MPQRTNAYQKLVYLIQRSLAPIGAQITESKEISCDGDIREIDVFIVSQIGPYTMKIAVEAKDENRPLDITVVEQISAKYRTGDGIPVNQVVIVARHGFTKAARKKAQKLNIELLTLCQASEADWKGIITIRPGAPHGHISFNTGPIVAKIDITPVPPLPVNTLIGQGHMICTQCKRDHGVAGLILNRVLREQVLSDINYQNAIQNALNQHNGHIKMTLNVGYHNKVIQYNDAIFPVESVAMEVHFHRQSSTLTVTPYKQIDSHGQTRIILQGEGHVAGKKIQLIVPDGVHSKQVVVDIHDANPADNQCSCAPPTNDSPGGLASPGPSKG